VRVNTLASSHHHRFPRQQPLVPRTRPAPNMFLTVQPLHLRTKQPQWHRQQHPRTWWRVAMPTTSSCASRSHSSPNSFTSCTSPGTAAGGAGDMRAGDARRVRHTAASGLCGWEAEKVA
jgi:hypothetical protein